MFYITAPKRWAECWIDRRTYPDVWSGLGDTQADGYTAGNRWFSHTVGLVIAPGERSVHGTQIAQVRTESVASISDTGSGIAVRIWKRRWRYRRDRG